MREARAAPARRSLYSRRSARSEARYAGAAGMMPLAASAKPPPRPALYMPYSAQNCRAAASISRVSWLQMLNIIATIASHSIRHAAAFFRELSAIPAASAFPPSRVRCSSVLLYRQHSTQREAARRYDVLPQSLPQTRRSPRDFCRRCSRLRDVVPPYDAQCRDSHIL